VVLFPFFAKFFAFFAVYYYKPFAALLSKQSLFNLFNLLPNPIFIAAKTQKLKIPPN